MYCNPYKGIIPVSLRHFQSAFGLALDADLADGRYGTAGFRSAAEGLDPVTGLHSGSFDVFFQYIIDIPSTHTHLTVEHGTV